MKTYAYITFVPFKGLTPLFYFEKFKGKQRFFIGDSFALISWIRALKRVLEYILY